MKYEDFTKDIKRGLEEIISEKLEDGIVVIRNVKKNNGVFMKAVSIIRKEENATPTIYLKEYFREYKWGRSIESICNEIFEVYMEGINRFKNNINIQDFSNFEQIKEKIYYKLVNYDMNRKLLEDLPHFRFLDMAIVFFIMVDYDENGQATAMIHNQHIENWNIEPDELRKVAFNNTWNKFPAIIKKMEDIIAEMIMSDLLEDNCDDEGIIKEEFQYGTYGFAEVENIIREEVEELKAERDIEMYVLTNSIKTNGATCITYPNIIKNFSKEHNCDVYIIPSSIHEVILIPGTYWEKEKINKMILEVNANELDPVEILSDHVYVFSKDDEVIYY